MYYVHAMYASALSLAYRYRRHMPTWAHPGGVWLQWHSMDIYAMWAAPAGPGDADDIIISIIIYYF